MKQEIRMLLKNEELPSFYVDERLLNDESAEKLTLGRLLEIYTHNGKPLIEQIGVDRVSVNGVEVAADDFYQKELGGEMVVIMVMEGGIVAG